MTITAEQLRKALPRNAEIDAWAKPLNAILPRYGITTDKQVAAFLAQTGHESGDFTTLEENLNYSAKRLTQVWPKRFPPKLAAEVAGNKRRIAEIAYGGRMGNNQPNDGYVFRGQGIIQLTGRSNYTEFGQSLNLSAEQAVEYVQTKQGAVEAAAWFWKRNNLNRWVDRDDFDGLSDAINIGKKTEKYGDSHGFSDRLSRYKKILAALEGSEDADEVVPVKPQEVTPTLVLTPATLTVRDIRRGSRGKLVEQVQQKLDIVADGQFGPKTEAKVEQWQDSKGYAATGALTKDQVNEILGL